MLPPQGHCGTPSGHTLATPQQPQPSVCLWKALYSGRSTSLPGSLGERAIFTAGSVVLAAPASVEVRDSGPQGACCIFCANVNGVTLPGHLFFVINVADGQHRISSSFAATFQDSFGGL